MALHATNLVLQTPPRMLERIIDRKINVSVALVGIRLVPNIDLLFIRQSDADMDLEKTAGPVVLPWTFNTTRQLVIRPYRFSSAATCRAMATRSPSCGSML
jgi:hypothetical protein